MRYTEIERKFLVNKDKIPDLSKREYMDIVQGYIDTGDKHILRIRQIIYMNIKGESFGNETKLAVKGEGNMIREEREVNLLQNQFSVLWPSFQKYSLQKKRYLIQSEDKKHTVELDVYRGLNDGLVVAEVEFETEEEANEYTPESWFGEEVTQKKEYSNYKIAMYGKPNENIPEL